MSEKFDVGQLQDEVVALVTAWADRGISPSESAVVLAGMSHALLCKLGYSLDEVNSLLVKAWEVNRGKL